MTTERDPLKYAELRVVYAYDCEVCGRENIVRPIVPDLPADEEREAREALGVEPWDEGELCVMPDTVTCKQCGSTFVVHDARNDDDAQ